MERLGEDAKQEGSKSGRRELEGERRRAEHKKIFVELLPGQVTGEHGSAPKVESVGTSFETSWCVPDVLLSVNVVTVPPYCVDGPREVLSISDCELVEPQTRSLSRKT